MIAISDSVDVLRNGWKDAATMFVPESPEIAELLHARLEMATLADELDEAHLLGAIADIESLAASAGSSSGAALALRLRRTVYEYLLALDAAPPAPDPVPPTENVGRTQAEARARRPSSASMDVEPTAEAVTADPGPDASAAATPEAATTDEASWRADADRDADDAAAAHAADAADAAQPDGEPTWQYDTLATDPGWDTPGSAIDESQLPLWTQPEEAVPADGFVADRAGFHIVEETHPNSVPGDGPIAPFQMPPFDADASQPQPPAPPSHGWMRPTDQPETPATPATPPPPAPAVVDTGSRWHVRDAEEGADAGSAGHDPLATDPKFAEIRHRIEDRLRRKRCDEAAALLQELAQEPGGRAVAELAMNAGDRCQSLGKSNAALNCFLAASRADPVYEQPLSRLADICIDDQDGDLAVSYLERVARLCKYRGDEKGVLRVYRRIASIAPYREDILQALLNAQSTGRLD